MIDARAENRRFAGFDGAIVRNRDAENPTIAWMPVLAAALLLLVMPVSARAGLREPHPHALLQLAFDADDGALDHHLAAAGAGHGHDRHADPFGLGPSPVDDAAAGAPAMPPRVQDAPSLLPSIAGLVWSFLNVLAVVWRAARPVRGGRLLAWPATGFPAGRACRPEYPPPRLLPGASTAA